MKKLMMFLMVGVACTTTALAQDSSMAMKPKMHKDGSMKMMKDCVMMEGGKMMVMKGGKSMAMDANVPLTNGATVMTDGTVKMADGTTKQLKDGDCVYMDGKMKTMKKDKMPKKMSE